MWSETITAGGFYATAAALVVFSLCAVTLKNIFHSALSLIAALCGVAVVYLYLGAEFLAVMQILIYVGAIMTLIIFAVMLTVKISDKTLRQHNEQKLVSFLIAASLAVFFITLLRRGAPFAASSPGQPFALEAIGRELLGRYMLPFEIMSLILLAALIGAVVVSRHE